MINEFLFLFLRFRLNRLEEAVSSYNDALRVDPFFVEAYNGRGNALMDFGHEDGTVLGRYAGFADYWLQSPQKRLGHLVLFTSRQCIMLLCKQSVIIDTN